MKFLLTNLKNEETELQKFIRRLVFQTPTGVEHDLFLSNILTSSWILTSILNLLSNIYFPCEIDNS